MKIEYAEHYRSMEGEDETAVAAESKILSYYLSENTMHASKDAYPEPSKDL